ncbi:hypothetical protein [Kribbella sp. NPDC051770]|uniref:hypothetical protein n=1 Tax=Kribbella sp. NPDC051770 TaxID=3155413 RepID=UPI00344A7042
MNRLLSRALVLALLVVPVGCAAEKETPAAAPVAATPTPTPTPVVAELTKETFAPKVLAALKKAGTFRMSAVLNGGPEGTVWTATADVRLVGSATDAAVTVEDGLPVRRIGKVLYMENDELTGNPTKPWVKLDLTKKDPEVLAAALIVVQDLNDAMFHQLIGGTAYATSFKPGPVQPVGGSPAREYQLVIDVKKAAAAGAFGVYVDRTDAKTLPAQLSLSILVDELNRPRQMNYVLADTKDGNTAVQATFTHFGGKLPIVAPPAAKTGKLDLS